MLLSLWVAPRVMVAVQAIVKVVATRDAMVIVQDHARTQMQAVSKS